MFKKTIVAIAGVAVFGVCCAQNAQAQSLAPTLWGVDEDDGQLFSIGDYNDAANTFTDFGKLKWNNNGTLLNIGSDIEAFTLDADGTAFLALDRGLGEFEGQHVNTLLSFNILDAEVDNTVVDILGVIGNVSLYDDGGDNISGLSIDPTTGSLFALLKNDAPDQNSRKIVDLLFEIDKADGSLIGSTNQIQGSGEVANKAEDMEFDTNGNLYVTDNGDDELYLVDPETGEIIDVVDENQHDGLDVGDSVKFEALGWDFQNDQLIGSDDKNNVFAALTTQNGENSSLGKINGLTDVEGIDFVPTADGQPTSVPEPASLLGLAAIGAIAAGGALKKKARAQFPGDIPDLTTPCPW